jgi:hypothetical protein
VCTLCLHISAFARIFADRPRTLRHDRVRRRAAGKEEERDLGRNSRKCDRSGSQKLKIWVKPRIIYYLFLAETVLASSVFRRRGGRFNYGGNARSVCGLGDVCDRASTQFVKLKIVIKLKSMAMSGRKFFITFTNCLLQIPGQSSEKKVDTGPIYSSADAFLQMDFLNCTDNY